MPSLRDHVMDMTFESLKFYVNVEFISLSGYVPDTDSEIGTLTLNSPQEWMDKGFHGNIPEPHTDIVQKNLIEDFHG